MVNTEATPDGSIKEVLDYKGREVFTTTPQTRADEAIRQMNERKVGALVVLQGDRPVGIFTERDVLQKLVGKNLDPSETSVKTLMSERLIVVTQSVSVAEALAIINKKRSRHLPVMEEGRLVGMVSSGDLTAWFTRKQEIHIQDLTDYILGNYPL